MKTIDKRKLSLEQQAMLEQHELSNKQLQTMDDVADMLQEVVNLLSDKNKSKSLDKVGSLLVDMRESLAVMRNREDPKPVDYAPVIKAVQELQTAVEKQDLKPVVKVTPPPVNVSPPEVKVDLKEVGEAIKGLKTAPPVSMSDEVSKLYIGDKAVKPKFAPVDAILSGDTAIVKAIKNKQIRVLACFIMAGDTTSIRLLSNDVHLSGLIQLVPSTGFVLGYNQAGWCETGTEESLIIQSTANVTIGGLVTYMEIGG